MFVHRSNGLEPLVEGLARLVSTPGPSPTEPEVIIVQSKGLERWLSMELSRRHGVWANAQFPFPRNFIERALAAVLDEDVEAAPRFVPEALDWSIAALLPGLVERPDFAELRGYLGDDASGARRVELAARIAGVFDQYPVYRPDLVLAWEGGADGGWQSALWRALVERHGDGHLARRAARFAAALKRGDVMPRALPGRVSLFGIGSLPPLFVDVLAALEGIVDVHLFVLSPSREHWAEIQSHRELAREARARDGDGAPPDPSLALAEGNPLLASLGRLGRDFQFVLESRVDYREGDRDLYREAGAGALPTMLTTLQADILGLRHRRAGNVEAPPLALRADDRSIAVHACHGPLREVEVLRDQLLAIFHEEPGIEPRDVIVMTPDLPTYAPLVEAIFSGDRRDVGALPFRIADRGLRAESPAADAFFALLDTASGRIGASAVLDLLGREAVRDRFDIGEDELSTVRSWVVAANVRWGVDAAHRATFQQPPFPETTWRFGLDRLLLGYAMPAEGRLLFHDTLPFDDVEGSEAALLGRFASFCEALFDVQRALATPRTVEGWRDALGAAMDRLLAEPDRGALELQTLRGALSDMADAARAAGFDEPVPLHVVRTRLEAQAAASGGQHAFLSGGVTVCALRPMRSIPFRVVCLLGMNDGVFPRAPHAPSFDLVARHPRRGDRSARDEDRYLFLEALLSAGSRLQITYVGRSMNDNAELPPSVVVSELLDVLDESFGEADAARRHVVAVHPLQPFSPTYFRAGGDPRIFSYSARFRDGARALGGERHAVPSFFRSRLPPPDDVSAGVTLDELATSFANPMRALLRDRLGLRLDDSSVDLLDREPMALDGLDAYKLGTDLLRRALAGDDLLASYPLIRASGVLPLGAVGFCRYQRALPEIEEMAAAVRAHTEGEPLPPREVSLLLGAERLTGWIRDLWPKGQLSYRFGSARVRDELALWIRHLAWQCVAGPADPRRSVLLTRDRKKQQAAALSFGPIAPEEARALLAGLLRWYRLGQVLPLRFFPEASATYVQAITNGKTEDEALAAARARFAPGEASLGAPSESDDPYVARVLGGRDPVDPALLLVGPPAAGEPPEPSFAELAQAVLGPMLDHREEPDRAGA